MSAGSPFGALALPLPPGVSLDEVLGSLSPQQRAALGGAQAAPAQPPAAPPSLLGAQPPQMPEPSMPSTPALPSLVGQLAPAMPKPVAPVAPRPVAPVAEDDADKPVPNAVPAQGRAPLSLAPPSAPATPAVPASPAATEPSFGDRLASGLKQNSDLLIGLGTGLMSTRGLGNGLAAGLQLAQKSEKDRAVTDLAKAEFGLKQQKAAQEQRALTGNAQYVMGKIPGISADQALTLGSNSTFMNELFKGVLPPTELFKQYQDKDGNIWSQNARTGQATVALKADEDKTQRPLTDPAERAKYGIAADDQKPYQVDANNKVSAIGGGGTSVSVDLGKKAAGEADAQILKKIDTSYDKAQGAIGTLAAIGRQKQAIDRGIISGWGADWQTQARAMAGKLLGLSDEDVSNSQAFEGAAASKSAELAKAISQAGHTTNMDLQLGKTIAGGDRSKTEAAIRQIIDAQELLAKDTIAHHNAGVDRYVGASPDMKDRMGWYHVETPEVYRYGQGTPNPVADPGSAPPPMTRMIGGKTYSKGPDGHWYEGK